MPKLAINGGPKVRTKLFPNQDTYDAEELVAAQRVMHTGRLSWYRGNYGPHFYGGPEIQALEGEWSERFGVQHSICCNSATSGLHIALGALGVCPGDEVIVTPWSMTCSATMPLAWGAKPVFADIELDGFCLEYESVKRRITKNTKAILTVSLFGQPFDPRLKEFGIPIVEDAAQAVGSRWVETYTDENKAAKHMAGTLGNIGVYSFNYGKHLTCGEGGMVVTNSDDLALKCRLVMNHAESVINDQSGYAHLPEDRFQWPQMFGFNLRMTEIQAAIIRAQLKKLNKLLITRMNNVKFLQDTLPKIPAISVPPVREGCTHTYYVLPFLWDSRQADGLHRDKFIEAVKAELTPRQGRDGEGVQIGCGYIKPIYLMPVFKSRGYFPGQCPNAEWLWKEALFLTLYHAPNSDIDDMMDVSKAFHKVWKYREELK